MSDRSKKPAYLSVKGRLYPLVTIETALRAEIDRSGKHPKSHSSDVVKTGVLKKYKVRWCDLNESFKSGNVVNGHKYKSLGDFSARHNIQSTLRGMFMECANVAFLGGRVPLPDFTRDPESAEKLAKIDQRLRNGDVQGWKSFMPWADPVPSSLKDFCMATGLIEEKNGKPVLPKTEKLLENIASLIKRP